MDREKTKQIFGCMVQVLKDNGFRSELLKSENEAQPYLLRIETPRNGKVMQDVLIEMCFISMPMPNEKVELLQFYATLMHGLPAERKAEIKRVVEYCTDYCALGYFGYFEPAGQIFLKHNTLVNVGDDLEKIITFITDNLSLTMASITRFIDALAAVATGVMTVDIAIEQELLPSV